MKGLLTYMRSINFAMIICLMAMFSQGFHSFFSFKAVSSLEGWLAVCQAMSFVIVFEFFTLFYLMRARKGMALFYSSCLLVMNLYYYWTNLTGLQLALGIFLSVIIPLSIFNIAEEVSQEYSKFQVPQDRADTLEEKVSILETVIEDLKEKKIGRKNRSIKILTHDKLRGK